MKKWSKPKTNEDLVDIYDHIYKQKGTVHHKRKGRLGPYGSHDDRDPPFVEFLERKFKEDRDQVRILDASCGRGHMSRTLRDLGFQVEGTEISKWLCDTELKDLTVHNLRYDQLDQLPAKSFDAVISNDVLEHLLNEGEVRRALASFKRLTKKYVLISVGTKRRTSGKYPESLKMDCGPLHLFTPGMKWWAQFLAKELVVMESMEFPSNYLALGKLKEDADEDSGLRGQGVRGEATGQEAV
jgi:SAM-dependent methyltransferase